MKEDKRPEGKASFITEARREQIREAAIRTLDEIGYVNASLAQIAKRAGISTALISYHFADKYDLMNHLLTHLVESSAGYILERVERAKSPTDQLNAYIVASLDYQAAHPARNTALVEIVFNARTPDGVPYYKLGDDEDEDPVQRELRRILTEGQRTGEFGAFRVDVVATMIQGAIGEYMLIPEAGKKADPQTYRDELVRMIHRIVKG